MKKIIYYLKNGRTTVDDVTRKAKMELTGDKVIFSNGSVSGFQDSCDAVVLGGDFPLIEQWAKSKGIEIITDDADSGSTEEKPKPADPSPSEPKRRGARKQPSEEGKK